MKIKEPESPLYIEKMLLKSQVNSLRNEIKPLQLQRRQKARQQAAALFCFNFESTFLASYQRKVGFLRTVDDILSLFRSYSELLRTLDSHPPLSLQVVVCRRLNNSFLALINITVFSYLRR